MAQILKLNSKFFNKIRLNRNTTKLKMSDTAIGIDLGTTWGIWVDFANFIKHIIYDSNVTLIK